jgi:hypothetical protein
MKNFKKNIWMYGIIGVMLVFVTMMTCFSILVSHQHYDLVITDYYKAEIDYQHQINKQKNYNALVLKPDVKVDTAKKFLHILFPEYTASQNIAGRICFYRPNNQSEDDTVALSVNNAGIADMSLEKFSRGKWEMRLDWKEGTTPYFLERTFRLQ